ncbi:site-specific recombinase [uncultured Mediterranean phage uvMED]|nr:site-specific recombinase [uncultured Mediterranean phage uvMED]
MKVHILKPERSGGKKLVVQAIHKGKKHNIETFELYEKHKAKALKRKLEDMDPNKVISQGVTFDNAFGQYKEYVLNNELITEETRLLNVGYVTNHIQPYIDEKTIDQFTAGIFKETYIPRLLKSKRIQVKFDHNGQYTRKRIDKVIGKKTVKETVGEFKKFIKYCLDKDWYIDPKILNFSFPKTFFREKVIDVWMPDTQDLIKIINAEKQLKLRCLYQLAAETGARLNEVLCVTYEDVEDDCIYFRHSVGKWNQFRPDFLKSGSRRRVEISPSLSQLIRSWMQQQVLPKREGKYRKLFNITKKTAAKKIKQSALKLGIKWRGGFAPFRKFSYSYLRDQKVFTDKQILDRYGWTNFKTPDRWYYKDLDTNKQERFAAINNLLTEE